MLNTIGSDDDLTDRGDAHELCGLYLFCRAILHLNDNHEVSPVEACFGAASTPGPPELSADALCSPIASMTTMLEDINMLKNPHKLFSFARNRSLASLR